MNIKGLFGFKKLSPAKPETQKNAELNTVAPGLQGFEAVDQFQGKQGGQSSGQGKEGALQSILPGSPPPGAYGTSLGRANNISITEMSGLPTSSVQSSLPLDALTRIGNTASGAVYHLDSSLAGAMEVKVRQIVTPNKGPATELNARLTHAESLQLANRIAGMPEAKKDAFLVEKASFDGKATVMEESGSYRPSLSAQRIEDEGRFSLEYVPSTGNHQAYRDRLRIRAFGSSDAERKTNLEHALSKVGMSKLVTDADPLQTQRLVRLSVLRMVAPQAAETLGQRLQDVSLAEMDEALAKHGIGPERLAQVRIEEVFPGHMAPVDPALGKAYADLGVRALMVGIRELDSARLILTTDGLMSSVERYGRGLHKAGASLAADEASGGAEFAFLRMVTPAAIESSKSISSSYGAGRIQLLSVGERMQEQLSRTDWHAYPNDSFGVSVGKWQADSDAVSKAEYNKRTSKFSARPVLDELVGQVDGKLGGSNPYVSGFRTSNETCLKAGVPARAFTHAVVGDEQTRTQFIELLRANGVDQLNGKPLEEAVLVARTWDQVDSQLGLST